MLLRFVMELSTAAAMSATSKPQRHGVRKTQGIEDPVA